LNFLQQTVVGVADEAEREMERRAIGPFRAAHALAQSNQAVIDGSRHIEGDKKTMHRAHVMPKTAQIAANRCANTISIVEKSPFRPYISARNSEI